MYIKSVNAANGTDYKTSKKEHIDKEPQNKFSDALNSAIKTTSFDSIFEKASNKYGVPVKLLKAVAKAESGFNANAQSKAGAQGVMQLMPATAKGLGVTDSFDAQQNIMGGAKLLSQLLNKYNGNTELALAAYNAGPGNVAKYGGIPPFKETQNYVKKVMGYCGGEIAINPSANSFSPKVKTDSNPIMSLNDYFNTSNDELEEMLLMNMLQAELQKSRMKSFDVEDDFLNGDEYRTNFLNIDPIIDIK
ncbi:MAG: lytic transglycosylase domain-containing protein [Oscillospiraceae bacterium]